MRISYVFMAALSFSLVATPSQAIENCKPMDCRNCPGMCKELECRSRSMEVCVQCSNDERLFREELQKPILKDLQERCSQTNRQ